MQKDKLIIDPEEGEVIDLAEQKLVNLIAAIIVDKIFEAYVFETSNNLPTDIK